MSRDLKSYRIFIASPGGLEVERKAFSDVVEEFNLSCARKRGVIFEPVGWEITLPGMGRPQKLINEDVCSCDYFIMVLHDRWGRPTEAGENSEYKSGTHEEYCVALECYHDNDRSMRQLVLLFEAIDPSKLADPGAQLQQVLDFQREIERKKELLFKKFDEAKLFENLVRRQLDEWLLDHEQGRGNEKVGPPPPSPPSAPPDSTVEPLPLEAQDTTSPTRELLDEAEHLADEGRLVDAETKFAEAVVKYNDPAAMTKYGHFLACVGRLDQATVMYRRVVELGELAHDNVACAVGYGNLGIIHRKRGELDRAEEMHQKSLAISEELGRKEGMASQYANLGIIYATRGELDRAEEVLKKSLAIYEQLGLKEGMASDYGNLGIIYRKRGDLDRAEEMLMKSLAIDEQLGRKEGIASQYANLGIIYTTRGELDRAEEVLKKSLAIYEQLGLKEGMASDYGNLGIIYRRRGDLDRAEEMHLKSLAIEEQLGHKEGMANDYGNLGGVYEERGDQAQAREYWIRSRDLYAEIGMPHMVQQVQGWIDELSDDDGSE